MLIYFITFSLFLYKTYPIQWKFNQHCGYWWPGAFSTRPSVATELRTHPCISRCLWVGVRFLLSYNSAFVPGFYDMRCFVEVIFKILAMTMPWPKILSFTEFSQFIWLKQWLLPKLLCGDVKRYTTAIICFMVCQMSSVIIWWYRIIFWINSSTQNSALKLTIIQSITDTGKIRVNE